MDSKSIGTTDVEHLALGAAFLASGGGGDPYHPILMARESLSRNGSVSLVDPDDLPPEALLLPLIVGGPPSAVVEALPTVEQVHRLRQVVESTHEQSCAAVLPIQLGPVNAVYPVVAAAELGLPCIDADLMQHCFPSLEMTLLALHGVPMSPVVIVDAMGAYSVQQTGSDKAGSRLLRATLAEMGMAALISAYRVTAGMCGRLGSVGSISRCVKLGEHVAALRDGDSDTMDECLRLTGGIVVFDGVVVDRQNDVSLGIPSGVVTAVSERANPSILRLDHGSETVAATIDGAVVAMVPDVITVVDADTGSIFQSSEIFRGHRVRVLSIPSDERWYRPDAVRLVRGDRTRVSDFSLAGDLR